MDWIIAAGSSALGGLAVLFIRQLMGWLFRLFRNEFQVSTKKVQVSTQEERGPVSYEHGFPEKAIKVTVRNQGGEAKQIQDLRLIFSGIYGLPVPSQAHASHTHVLLPATLEGGVTESWYFPAEKVASAIGNLSSKTLAQQGKVRLYPQVIDAGGKVYRGPRFGLSLDVNSHWP